MRDRDDRLSEEDVLRQMQEEEAYRGPELMSWYEAIRAVRSWSQALVAEVAQRTVRELAQSYLARADEDWTWIDPEDVKRLARAVLERD